MSTTIDVSDLRVGMFVHLDRSWLAHPFPVGSFRITQARQIDAIRALGLTQLRWSPQRSEIATITVAAADAAPSGQADDAPTSHSSAQAAEIQRRAQLQAQRESAALCQQQFDEANEAWRDMHAKVLSSPWRARADAECLSRALVDKLLVDGELSIRVLSCEAGDSAATHAMNVAVMALLLGRERSLSAEQMFDLGVGAMLHDVGKLELPARLRHADERFEADQSADYRRHVALGVAQGRRMGLASGALLVLAQHHEHADGSGFPQRLTLERLSPAARIVALVDAYDKLCNPPLLARARTPHEALSWLYAKSASSFDTALLDAFIRMMGVYPSGSVVQLSDERFALVISVNAARPLRPNVLVFDRLRPRDESVQLDLTQRPDLSIARSLKPAQLPSDAARYLAPRARAAYFFEAVPAPAAPLAEHAG